MKRASFHPRALCERCRRPVGVCVCAHLPELAPRTRVLIVQHPREQRMAIGTARMASRCLRGSTVVVGTHVETHPEIVKALADPARRPVLLWPGPDAKDLATSPPTGPITLFVVDGTWSTASKLVKQNPTIAALPRYGISPTTPSQYRIRREPRAECLSTIEAISNALGLLEGDPEPYEAMLVPFRAMIDAQIAYEARGGSPRDRSRLARRLRPVWAPPGAIADPARVVVVAAESNAWPVDAKDRHPDELVHWIAIRGDGSERFEHLARPTHPLAPSVERHTELSAEALLAGTTREALWAAFRGFLREDDALATWGTYAFGRLREAGVAMTHPMVDLRRVMADWLRGSPSSMETCAHRLGLSPPRLGEGRGGRRLGLMYAMYRQVLGPRRT